MKVLFDHNLPRRLRKHLPEHEVLTAKEMNWEQLRNGALLSAASEAHFEVFLTIDKQFEHQQNLRALPLPIVVLDGTSNTLAALEPFVPFLRTLFAAPLEGALYIVHESGAVLQLTEPRSGER